TELLVDQRKEPVHGSRLTASQLEQELGDGPGVRLGTVGWLHVGVVAGLPSCRPEQGDATRLRSARATPVPAGCLGAPQPAPAWCPAPFLSAVTPGWPETALPGPGMSGFAGRLRIRGGKTHDPRHGHPLLEALMRTMIRNATRFFFGVVVAATAAWGAGRRRPRAYEPAPTAAHV